MATLMVFRAELCAPCQVWRYPSSSPGNQGFPGVPGSVQICSPCCSSLAASPWASPFTFLGQRGNCPAFQLQESN